MDNNSIRSRAFSSVIWKFLERIIAQLVSLVVSIILARILMPDDYSVVSIVAIFFTFANILISGGLNSSLIQKKDADSEDYSTVLFFSIFVSFIMYAVLFFTAPIIASIYRHESLILIIRIMALILPVEAVKSIWCAYISSSLQFRKFFFATIGGTLFSAVLGIALALKGCGAWALVAQQMSNTLIDTIILVLSTHITITLKLSFTKLKSHVNYGWKVLVSSLINTLYLEMTPLLIGVKYSPSDLSYYSKGRSFPSLLSTTTTNTLSAVLFPVLSKYQDNKEALLKYTRLFIRLASYISFPVMLGFFMVADDFVRVVLTEKWLAAVPYIQIFCLSSMFDMINIGNCETIKAMGRSDLFLLIEIIKKTSYFVIIGIFLFASKTPVMLACGFIACTVVAIVVNSIPNQKLINYKVKYQLKDLLPNLASALGMCIPIYIFGLMMRSSNINLFIILVIKVFLGAITYLLISVFTHNESFYYLLSQVKRVLKK